MLCVGQFENLVDGPVFFVDDLFHDPDAPGDPGLGVERSAAREELVVFDQEAIERAGGDLDALPCGHAAVGIAVGGREDGKDLDLDLRVLQFVADRDVVGDAADVARRHIVSREDGLGYVVDISPGHPFFQGDVESERLVADHGLPVLVVEHIGIADLGVIPVPFQAHEFLAAIAEKAAGAVVDDPLERLSDRAVEIALLRVQRIAGRAQNQDRKESLERHNL